MIAVTFSSENVRIQLSVKDGLKKISALVAKKFKLSDSECGVAFVGKTRIRQLNKTYRGKDSPTDVLSFAMSEAIAFPGMHESEKTYLGEIFINIDYVNGISAASEEKRDRINFLFLHGLLHLLGIDHATKKDEQRMRVFEKKFLQGKTFYHNDDKQH